MHLVVADFDGAVALLGQGQEGQGRRGAQAEGPTAAGARSGDTTGRGTVAVVATNTSGSSARSSVGRIDASCPHARREGAGRRRPGRGRCASSSGGGVSIAVISLLKPAVRDNLVEFISESKAKENVGVLRDFPGLFCVGQRLRSSGGTAEGLLSKVGSTMAHT